MAKFTKAGDLSGDAIPQSVGPKTAGDIQLDETFQVFQPHQGRDLIYLNPQLNNGSTEITQSNDNRIPLGTYTLNNRDFWENNNFNESTFQPYLNEEYDYRESYKLKTWGSTQVNTPDGYIVLPTVVPGDGSGEGSGDYDESNTGKFSVEALPFVINPNNQDIIHLDRYYDKEIDKENYELATEGKINLKLEVKRYGRVPPTNPPSAGSGVYFETTGYFNNFGMNIDIFSDRYSLGNYIDNTIRRPGVTSISGSNDGCHLFKLNWNDGTELEHTSEPKLLEDSVLFEHFYEKPGFYSITGVIYRVKDGKLKTWEKFQTNILLNPSPNYELNLYDYNNFASIGGISKDSTLVKSLYNIVGINPLTQDNEGASEEVIEKLNEFDKIQLLNVLGKVDYEVIQPYENLIEPYSRPITDNSLAQYVESELIVINGCADPNASNYWVDENGPVPDGYVLVDDDSCIQVIYGCTDDSFWNYNDLANTEYNPSTCLNSSISDYTFNLIAAPGGFIELTWDKPVDVNLFMPSGWNIDWNTVQYEIQYKQVGSNSWSTLATVDYDTDTYEFNSDSTGYVVNTNYQFRIRIQTPNPLPAFSTDVVSNWNYVDSDTYIGGLVNIYMSQTPLTVTPTKLSTTTLSSNTDETYPNSLTITAVNETGVDFSGWIIQEPHTADWGDFISIEDTSASSTTVSWANDDDSLNHDATTISIKADYETVQGGEGGYPVNVVIYAGNYGSVSTDGFELTSTNQNHGINAYPQSENDDFTYSFVKWEVQDGVGFVGFGSGYSSETPVKNTDLYWNNVGNPNPEYASVKAFFSRQTKGGGTGGTGKTCFLKGTMITMADKTTKPIEQIQVGNLVMSYDEDTNLITHNKVIDRFYHQFDETNAYLIINNNIRVTENHVMYVPNNRWTEEPGDKWLRADHIIVGDYLYDTELNKVEVKSIEKINESVVTYNFEVENTHTYFAENVIVHNEDPGGGSGAWNSEKTGGSGTDDSQT